MPKATMYFEFQPASGDDATLMKNNMQGKINDYDAGKERLHWTALNVIDSVVASPAAIQAYIDGKLAAVGPAGGQPLQTAAVGNDAYCYVGNEEICYHSYRVLVDLEDGNGFIPWVATDDSNDRNVTVVFAFVRWTVELPTRAGRKRRWRPVDRRRR